MTAKQSTLRLPIEVFSLRKWQHPLFEVVLQAYGRFLARGSLTKQADQAFSHAREHNCAPCQDLEVEMPEKPVDPNLSGK